MSFARALFTVSGLTVVSRVGGFIRDTLTAIFLGAGVMSDAFFVAQRLPNLFRSLFAEGAFSAAFVPLYATEKEKKGDEAALRFAGEAMGVLVGFLTPFTLVVMMGMPWVIQLIAPGFQNEPDKFALAVSYSRITFPYLLLVSITALQTGVLNAHGRFGPGAAAPVALNIVMILALLIASLMGWEIGEALAWGTAVSGVVQAGWLAISCYRARVSIPFLRPRLNDMTRRLFRQLGPGAVGAGAAQINLLLTTILASLLPTGAVSYLYYADRLNQLPLGIVGIAVATTLLPILSRSEALGKEATVRHYTSRAIEFCLLLGLPAAIGLGVAAQPIIQTLFEHGAFTHADTIETAKTLMAYAIGIPAFLLIKVFASRFFARHDVKTPVKIAMFSMVVNVIGALLLLGPMGHVGMALAGSLATWTNALQLYFYLRRRGELIADQELKRRIPRFVLSALGMAGATLGAVIGTETWFTNAPLGSKMVGLSIIIGLSCAAYAVLLQVTSAMKLGDIVRRFKQPAP